MSRLLLYVCDNNNPRLEPAPIVFLCVCIFSLYPARAAPDEMLCAAAHQIEGGGMVERGGEVCD